MWPAHYEQFGSFLTTMSEGDREVLHITDVKAIQQKINSAPREKAKHSAAEDKVLAGQAAIKNGMVTESNSAIIDLAAFNMKAAITSVLQQVKNSKQALHTAETCTQGLARCLRKAKQSLEGAWADTQTVSFANTGVKHGAITMADVWARALWPLHPHNASPEVRDWRSQPQPECPHQGHPHHQLQPLLGRSVSSCQVWPDPSHPEA